MILDVLSANINEDTFFFFKTRLLLIKITSLSESTEVITKVTNTYFFSFNLQHSQHGAVENMVVVVYG